jgi:SsrA-binding protein
MEKNLTIKTIARNKKVQFDYFVEDKLEAGIALMGSEIKSIRLNGISLNESFIFINERFELCLVNAHIKEYQQASYQNHNATRTRKLLVHKKELKKLHTFIACKGYTLMPVEVYFKGKNVKVLIGSCKGKKQYDKREVLKKADVKKEMDRTAKNFNAH